MTTIAGTLSTEKGISVLIRRHPLVAYFFLAYAGMWIVISPLVMDSFGWIELSDGISLLLFILSSLSGPTVAAYWVTGVLEGKAGMGRLLRRTFQLRAGLQWYAVALFIFLSVWLIAYSFLYNGAPLAALAENPSLLLSVFLPSVIMGLLIPSIGEEPGWRGFALPRLQAAYGPVIGTLILGTLHGVWHLPALFTPLLGPFTVEGFIVFVLTAAAGTFIYTWLFNNTRGSVWMAMVLHASSNAASQLVSSMIPKEVELTGWMKILESGWLNVIVFGAVALLLTISTRGTLGYRPDQADH
ncbi:MAG TPA: type II CAAX endopeptidase family protein [Anaerolineales bacterium]|nr:type II CAAX endopeptidase family protein [Anaerolineales bacterium]